MECRTSLVLALGVAAGSLGCVNHAGLPVAATDEPNPAKIVREADLPHRPPRPETCVAFGRLNEQAAADPNRPPVEKQQLLDRARKTYQQALKLDPKNPEALLALARLYNTMDDHERAVATYRKAIEARPKQAALCYELGMCHARHQEWEPSLPVLRRAVELEPEERQYSNALGFVLARTGRYEESLAAFTKTGSEANAHYNLARMLHHLKQDELSKQHLQVALSLKPDLTAARELLTMMERPTSDAAAPILNSGFQGFDDTITKPRESTPNEGTPPEGTSD
jgi:tetratricopeptide (TPR) repeat protein